MKKIHTHIYIMYTGYKRQGEGVIKLERLLGKLVIVRIPRY